MKNWVTFSAVAVFLLLGSTAFGDHHGRPKGKHRGGHIRNPFNPRMMERLDLNSEQKESLKLLRFETKKRNIKLRADVELSKTELRQLLSADVPDEAAVMAAIEKTGAAKIAMEKLHVEHILNTRAVIGPEKWHQLKQMNERMRQRYHQGRGRHQGDRDQRPRRGSHNRSQPEHRR